ncbi:ElyC/SanA/YdcF family protein [Flavobacterium sp. DGU11]|uniref:ElyC/SanA/YdcF family protein n=1 Tax=Flavobacterium arundinis TaxID=3139143 RepID=A0ABU9HVT5_9FLAO
MSQVLTATALIFLFLFSVTPLPIWMVRQLEQHYVPYNPTGNNEHMPILILGGGHTNDPSMNYIHRLSPPALSRLVEGVRLYQRYPGSKIILSGYSESGKTPSAVIMARSALSLGVAAQDTMMMVKPATTWQEALCFKKRFGTEKEFILVTSASHMPRAVEAFRKLGLKPVPAPANYLIQKEPDSGLYPWKPSSMNFTYTETAFHEYVGRLYYRWFKEE